MKSAPCWAVAAPRMPGRSTSRQAAWWSPPRDRGRLRTATLLRSCPCRAGILPGPQPTVRGCHSGILATRVDGPPLPSDGAAVNQRTVWLVTGIGCGVAVIFIGSIFLIPRWLYPPLSVARRPVQARRRQAHQLRDVDRGCPALLAGCPVLGRSPGRPDRRVARLPAGRPDRGHGGDLVHLPRRLRSHQGHVEHRLADGVDPGIITSAEAAAGSVDGLVHAHARARWTGRILRVEIEGWVDPSLTVSSADALGRQVAQAVASQVPEAGSFTWTARAAPA